MSSYYYSLYIFRPPDDRYFHLYVRLSYSESGSRTGGKIACTGRNTRDYEDFWTLGIADYLGDLKEEEIKEALCPQCYRLYLMNSLVG